MKWNLVNICSVYQFICVDNRLCHIRLYGCTVYMAVYWIMSYKFVCMYSMYGMTLTLVPLRLYVCVGIERKGKKITPKSYLKD